MLIAPRLAMIVPGNNRVTRPRGGPFFLGCHNMIASFHEAFHIEKTKLCDSNPSGGWRGIPMLASCSARTKNELLAYRPLPPTGY